ncbi:MAG: hypothetical protein Q9212_006809 [Teloschistes hypoglaucus]
MAGGKIPDAWDDDWVEKANTPAVGASSTPKQAKLSKAERRAKQLEFNRQLWEDAETQNQNQNFFLNSRTEIPLKSDFKPAMKVLSRKPNPGSAAPTNAASGLGQLSIEDDDDEEDEVKTTTLTAEERQIKAQKDREEKQKKYEEARQRLFGTGNSSTGKSSGITTPPKQRMNGDSKGPSRNRPARDSRPSSAAGAGGPARQLYDPNYTAKSDSTFVQNYEGTPNVSAGSTPVGQQPIRMPRGPDGSGRGGHGFAPR